MGSGGLCSCHGFKVPYGELEPFRLLEPLWCQELNKRRAGGPCLSTLPLPLCMSVSVVFFLNEGCLVINGEAGTSPASSCLSILHPHPGASWDWVHCGAGDREIENLGHCRDGERAPCVGRGISRGGGQHGAEGTTGMGMGTP